jgi:serine/threonine-protein kinase
MLHYRIIEKLGEGGMGVVYLAEDSKLERITTIYAIEETEDQIFIVMEYIDGKELRDIVETTGPVALMDAINYAVQIAEGLQAAHKKDITHRDIKSSNIMITEDGQVKIMDFGLAKIGVGSLVTKVGSTLGTVAYMSPEQARGEAVDFRSDIWSLGVVLYEMVLGRGPL